MSKKALPHERGHAVNTARSFRWHIQATTDSLALIGVFHVKRRLRLRWGVNPRRAEERPMMRPRVGGIRWPSFAIPSVKVIIASG